MKCDVCVREAMPHHIDCPRCYHLISTRGRYLSGRRIALKKDYVPPSDRFRCGISGVVTDDDDKASPWFTMISLRDPRNPPESVVLGAVMAMFKSDLVLGELITVIPALDDTLNNGRPFDRDLIPFTGWYRVPRPPAPSLPGVDLKTNAFRNCEICIRPALQGSLFCSRCHRLLINHTEIPARIAGLKKYYDATQDGFLDAYLGVLLNDSDFHDPYYLVMDHIVPGKPKLAPTSFWLNDSKGCLSDIAFKRVIKETANHLRTGEPFDRNVLTRQEWKRNLYDLRLKGRKIA
jgi:hypothetical protein